MLTIKIVLTIFIDDYKMYANNNTTKEYHFTFLLLCITELNAIFEVKLAAMNDNEAPQRDSKEKT